MPASQSIPYLIRRIADADIEIWKLSLHNITEKDIQALCLWLPLHTLSDLCSHSRIQLDSNDLLRLLQNFDRQISRTRTNFEYSLRRGKIGND